MGMFAAGRLVPLVLVVAAGLSLSGCGSLYLHDGPTQASTAKAKEAFDKVSLASVFDAEATYLKELERQQNAAVEVEFGLYRDTYLLNALHGRKPSGKQEKGNDGLSELIGAVDGMLNVLVGATDRTGTQKWSAFIDLERDSTQTTKDVTELRERLRQETARIKVVNPAAGRIEPPTEFTLDEALANLEQHLAGVDEKKKQSPEEKKKLEEDLAKAIKALDANNASQEQFTELVTEINALLKKAKDQSNPYLELLVSEAGATAAGALQGRLDALIKVTDPKDLSGATDSTSRATLGFVSAALGVKDAFDDPPRVPHPNTVAVSKAWYAYLLAQAQGRVQEAQAREALLRQQVTAIGEQVYYLSLAGSALQAIASKRSLNADKGLESLLQDKEMRLHAYEALYNFSCAWNRGFVPSEQLERVAVNIADRQAKLQRSRESADAWIGTLKPAVATLAAYGESGIDPKLLAELLKTIGIGAIAVGVN